MLIPPSGRACHSFEKSASESDHQVRYAMDASTTQAAKRRMNRRTTLTGPSTASVAATAPNTSVHAHFAPTPTTSSESADAAAEMMISSNVAQPQHLSAFRSVGA